MRFRGTWKVGAVAAIFGLVAVVAVACGGDDDEGATTEDQGPAAAPVLFVDANTVLGSAGIPEEERADRVCVLKSRYAPGEEVVWRIKVFDPATGDTMDDTQLDSVVVELPDGQTFEAEHGGHPRDETTDFFWATSWDIPADYPTGSLPYTVRATAADGRTGEFTEFNVASSLLTIVPAE